MATSWVLGKISNALQPTIQSGVSTAGTFAGGAFNTVGSAVNGVGESINGTIKRYGDGVKDYGNGVMDWSSAPGSRAQTAVNPLGLTGGKATGKQAATSPSVYAAPGKPKPTPSKTLTTTSKTVQPQKKVTSAPTKKALPAPTPTKKVPNKVTNTPVKPAGVPAKPVNQGAIRKPATVANTGSKLATPVKPSTVSATKARAPVSQRANYVGAANPLGLS